MAVANPLDYHTFIWNNEPALTETFTAMAGGGFALNMLVLDFPRDDRCSDADWWPTVNAFEAALKRNAARGAIVASMTENLPEGHAEALLCARHRAAAGHRRGDGCGRGGSLHRRRLASAGRGAGGWRQSGAGRAVGACPTRPKPRRCSRRRGCRCRPGGASPTPRRRCGPPRFSATPVVLKALGLAHKSEHGAVRLGLRDAESVRAAARDLEGLGSGLYVERMVEGGVAELIVGVTRDPLFGPLMTIGSGGVLVELLKDSATLLLPASRA